MTNAKRPGAGDAGPKAEGLRKQTFHPSNGITKAEQGYPADRRKRPPQVSDPAREPPRRRRAISDGLSEQRIQRCIVEHLTARPAEGLWWCHVPNGGFRTKPEAAILRGLGLRKGAPDLLFVHQGRTFGLELKRVGGRPSEDQLACLAAMEAAGASTCIAEGVDRALACLEAWGLLRGRAS